MRILLVDDTVEIRELLALKFQGLPAEVVQASTGSEAAKLLELESFDLIISDFNMPDGNGDVVLGAKMLIGLNTPFIYFSSKIDLKTQPGVLAIFHKLQTKELLDLVRELRGEP